MKKFYAHYTFIYPDIFLKNNIVILDADSHLVSYYLFQKEEANTEFFSGLQIFLPESLIGKIDVYELANVEPSLIKLLQKDFSIRSFSI